MRFAFVKLLKLGIEKLKFLLMDLIQIQESDSCYKDNSQRRNTRRDCKERFKILKRSRNALKSPTQEFG